MNDDVGDRGEFLSERLLEFAGELVRLGRGMRGADRDGDEQHVAGVGWEQAQVTRAACARSPHDVRIVWSCVRVVLRSAGSAAIGCSRGSRCVSHIADAGQRADCSFDPFGDLVGGWSGSCRRGA